MAKKKAAISYEQLSNYEKFQGACEGLKDVLNKKLCDNLLIITNRYVDEEITAARNQAISPELQEIEKILLEYRKKWDNPNFGIPPDMWLEMTLIKKVKDGKKV